MGDMDKCILFIFMEVKKEKKKKEKKGRGGGEVSVVWKECKSL